jgi:phospholipid/cholesterol/gamma-HCH transport system ATP-binding protein
MQNFIEIRGLYFARDDKVIFDGIDMDIPAGKITAIMGPSGTGKTTLLRLIGGQLRAQRGRVVVDGQDVAKLSRNELFQLRKRLGMLFQSSALFNDMSVFDNVAFPLRQHTRLPESMIRDIVLLKLQAVGLRGARTKMPVELSGGMARRAALARTIALDPELIMYDEPFTGQDPISMGVLVNLIHRLNQALSATSVVVSHDVHETAKIADLIHLIAEGKVIASGSPTELSRSSNERVRQFMHGLPDGPVPFHYPAASLAQDLGL